MREQFERLPEIESSLSEHIWFGSDGLYHSALVNFQGLVGWLNGAWYAYQEQQKKIDDIKSISDCAEAQLGMACVKWKELYQEQQKRIDAVLNLCKSRYQKVDYWVDHFIDDVEELLK